MIAFFKNSIKNLLQTIEGPPIQSPERKADFAAPIDANTLSKVLYEYGRHQLNALKPHSEQGRILLQELFMLQSVIDSLINQACMAYYNGKHPKHYLWLGHNQYLYDRVNLHDRVLDIGCGGSYYQQWIAEKASEVVGIDILPDRIELSRRNNICPNVHYFLMDATKELPEGNFDVAICSHVLEHLDKPILLLKNLAQQIPRLLVKVPLVDSGWMKLVKKDIGIFYFDDADHRREYTEALLSEQLETSGWEITEIIRGYDLRAMANSRCYSSEVKTQV